MIEILKIFVIISMLTSCEDRCYGNHLSLTVQGKVDSLEFSYCESSVMFNHPYYDSVDTMKSHFEGNIEPDYARDKCMTSFKLFFEGNIETIKGDTFSNFNADGNHHYIILNNKVIYEFSS
ncbi:hypothetical protein [Lewinella sp. 4G2]|uniref:hypothetical protein n=1 Tax=Lewinella sp. 4G2 TaxID=1803372 RepID=UPI0012F8191F|nr:hypothetical protein [Lewinella sp. 4G2]